MGRLIKINEIEQFENINKVRDDAISEEIIATIRKLDEKTQLEPAIQQILFCPDETPHGPTEIADVLTYHVTILGERRLSAFVLKGKSSKKVTSQLVAHQFARLLQVNGLSLAVFVAVGHIQDDAKRDFCNICQNAGLDYLIIDAQDVARLLIAYKKICPIDGTYYDYDGVCESGHSRDESLPLQMQVDEKIKYTILEIQDKIHIGAKRYVAVLLVDKHYMKDTIRKIIIDVTEQLKTSNYYRKEIAAQHFQGRPADVVWLHVYVDIQDILHANWICMTSWINPSLDERFRPMESGYQESLDGIKIKWNDRYDDLKDAYQSYYTTKEDYWNRINLFLSRMREIAQEGIDLFVLRGVLYYE